jgi:hypothetical protein
MGRGRRPAAAGLRARVETPAPPVYPERSEGFLPVSEQGFSFVKLGMW